MGLLSKCLHHLNEALNRPRLILSACCLVAFISLIAEGTLYQLWSLHQSDKEMSRRMDYLKEETKKLSMKIARASDPDFLELEANEYFDVVEKGDLIFIFSEDVNRNSVEVKWNSTHLIYK